MRKTKNTKMREHGARCAFSSTSLLRPWSGFRALGRLGRDRRRHSFLAVAALAAAKGDLSKNLGIFGDSGVEYSNGVEDFFATIFGAKQQNTNINKADIGAFTDDIAKAGQAAFFGK